MENVIALTFRGTDEAREAVDALLRLHRSGDIRLEAAAVVERTEDGRVVVLEHAETSQLRGTAGGGLIGALIGLLAGPVGVLAGGATGAVVVRRSTSPTERVPSLSCGGSPDRCHEVGRQR